MIRCDLCDVWYHCKCIDIKLPNLRCKLKNNDIIFYFGIDGCYGSCKYFSMRNLSHVADASFSVVISCDVVSDNVPEACDTATTFTVSTNVMPPITDEIVEDKETCKKVEFDTAIVGTVNTIEIPVDFGAQKVCSEVENCNSFDGDVCSKTNYCITADSDSGTVSCDRDVLSSSIDVPACEIVAAVAPNADVLQQIITFCLDNILPEYKK